MSENGDHHQPAIFLIPNLLGDVPIESSLPSVCAHVVGTLTHFLVEEEKSARKLIKALLPSAQIRELSIQKIPKHPTPTQISELTAPLSEGHSIGILSEAGCPGIADPGREIVLFAHQHAIQVIPLVGPCSMVLALMASGLNGQLWRFAGYLPVETSKRAEALVTLEKRALTTGETQIVMETPYRNDSFLADILSSCSGQTLLCIAQGLTTPLELVKTKTIDQWRSHTPKLGKLPTLFLLGHNKDHAISMRLK